MHDAADRHHRVRAVFDEALQRDSAARAAYLDEACRADRDLRSDIVRLLAAHNSAETFLERPAWLPPLPLAVEDDFPGTTRFTVRRRLGAGGMGVVYEVDDTVRGEIVALKTLRHFTPADVYRLKGEFRKPRRRRAREPRVPLRALRRRRPLLLHDGARGRAELRRLRAELWRHRTMPLPVSFLPCGNSWRACRPCTAWVSSIATSNRPTCW